MTLRTLDSLGDVAGRTVIVRCDLNVPLDGDRITDDGRIRASGRDPHPPARRRRQGRRDLASRPPQGRAGGEVQPRAGRDSTRGTAGAGPVAFATDTVGESATATVDALEAGGIAVLENLRFNAGETSKERRRARIVRCEDRRTRRCFVSDGFGVVHRKQASVYELAELLPSAAGLLIAAELDVLDRLTERPAKPYTVVLGGSKVSDKLGVIGHLLPRVDTLLIGGGMMFTFLAAQGHQVGASLLEKDQIETVRGYLAEAERLGVTIEVPTDVVVASKFGADAEHQRHRGRLFESTPWRESASASTSGPRHRSASLR
jgi:phosphoglycerate kinase